MQDGTIDGKVKNTRAQIILNNSEIENWGTDTQSSTGIARFFCRGYSTIIKGNTEILCDKFKYYSVDISSNFYINGAICNPSSANISFCKSDITSLDAWKTYVEANPILIEVELKEPDETAFTPEQQAVIDEIINDGTYKEVTHYTAEASLNPDMEIGYYKDLEILLNNLINS